ncbi:MAG: bacteriophage holin [archaeon]
MPKAKPKAAIKVVQGKAKLSPKALGLAIGIICAAVMLLASIWNQFFDLTGWKYLLASFYRGYSFSVGGTILGMIYGFIDGFIFGALTAWLYNKFN